MFSICQLLLGKIAKDVTKNPNLTLLRLGLTGGGYPFNLLIINKCLFFVGFIANCSLILDKYIDVKFLFLCAAMKNINETFVFLNLKNQIKWFFISHIIFFTVFCFDKLVSLSHFLHFNNISVHQMNTETLSNGEDADMEMRMINF